jgi:hypothetical protein
VQEAARSLAKFGKLKSFELTRTSTRGGMQGHVYKVKLARKALVVIMLTLPDERVEQYLIAPD